LWQFSLAGFLLALGVGVLFVALEFVRRLAYRAPLEAMKASDEFFFMPLLPIGALMGATIWLIAEWRVKRVR
jgi:hypothetical protein